MLNNALLKDEEEFGGLIEQLLMLKENYHRQGEYQWEDEVYYKYMNLRRKKKDINWIKRFLLLAIEAIGGYGTKPFRIVLSMAIVWIVWAVLFTFVGADTFGGDVIPTVSQGLYDSAITFLTISTVNAGRTLTFFSPIEGFIGLFLMAYFTVAIVRKTLR